VGVLASSGTPRHDDPGAENAARSTGGSRPRRPARHFKRSCDLRSLTSSAAHSRASGIFPASLNARAFAKAWLSADRSAADSFPVRASRGLRAAADMLRIAPGPTAQLRSGGDECRSSALRSQRLSVPSRLAVALMRRRSKLNSPPREPTISTGEPTAGSPAPAFATGTLDPISGA
jgi:hypothetical protein